MLKIGVQIAVGIVALLHFWFMILEMFLWKKPLGLKAFKMSMQKAEVTSVLAANQGLYNGFLGAGLVTGLLLEDPSQSFSFQVFFLSCIIVAGSYGGWSFSRRIFYVQAVPAVIALVGVILGKD